MSLVHGQADLRKALKYLVGQVGHGISTGLSRNIVLQTAVEQI